MYFKSTKRKAGRARLTRLDDLDIYAELLGHPSAVFARKSPLPERNALRACLMTSLAGSPLAS